MKSDECHVCCKVPFDRPAIELSLLGVIFSASCAALVEVAANVEAVAAAAAYLLLFVAYCGCLLSSGDSESLPVDCRRAILCL